MSRIGTGWDDPRLLYDLSALLSSPHCGWRLRDDSGITVSRRMILHWSDAASLIFGATAFNYQKRHRTGNVHWITPFVIIRVCRHGGPGSPDPRKKLTRFNQDDGLLASHHTRFSAPRNRPIRNI